VQPVRAEFKAGAAIVDVTPPKLPVLVNGGMTSRTVGKVKTPVNARALALSDGKVQVAIVVVDSCMMTRELLDEAKALASKRTGIAPHRMLISATHSHSAPSSMGCLGTDADPAYVPFLRDKLVEAIAAAQAALVPAKIGFARGQAAEFTAVRQWIRRPDRIEEDPFGNRTVRANMHAGKNWDDVTGEAGPEDPELALISVQTKEGHPLAVLGNFSMHYFGDSDISADYFGLLCEGLKRRLAAQAEGRPTFVGIMSHGCSGDIWRRDYTKPESAWNAKLPIDEYAAGLVEIAMKALAGIEHRQPDSLSMVERRLPMTYRVPDKQRLEWAQRVMAEVGDRPLKTTTEVYAREQILLHERQKTEVVVQALRIGDIAIATTPCETYAITGLKIKAASPLPQTMVIELANGGDGYIPPPEQHLFGGYNTWAARSAGLEVQAEPKITEAAIGALEEAVGKPRRPWTLTTGPATQRILDLKPVAYWRLNEFSGPHAIDATGHGRDGIYEREITYYLAGPDTPRLVGASEVNRAPHLVGGRLRGQFPELRDRYTIAMWVWNGMPNSGRDVSGWIFSRGQDHALSNYSEHFGIGGASAHTGRLIYLPGADPAKMVAGKSEVPRWQWQHVAFVRDGGKVRAYLNGRLELEADVPTGEAGDLRQCFFGGRTDNHANWEGRLDEVAVFDRVLDAEDLAALREP
jgi:hypothetical protein